MTYPSEPNPYSEAGQPGAPGQQPPFQGFPAQQPPAEQKNTLGILAIVFAALFDICAIGLILGIVAVATAKGNQQQKKFGWIAIGIAIAWGVLGVILSLTGMLDLGFNASTTAP
ncbi:conserved hypothetical protein [Segniliparus rotundus DSM 44985]|uniref:DUF4190 domain-containing protein n=1 Tax=Segniliparus rotundus (strain ATCC BAA-972 / CDC 1076 / CIP 108378 / DSM 44985 / JCM 13578) TaxID=640132 RepID=D6Z8N8_SEGRD|nr:hypothetical protein [Segniliparus rotundus]ADG98318.1 conserved hypothetical protein [Segniliparus rotundus DSM 44985]